LRKIDIQVDIGPKGSLLAQLKLRSVLKNKVLEAQLKEEKMRKIVEKIKEWIEVPFSNLQRMKW
jgi:hypothetical protein